MMLNQLFNHLNYSNVHLFVIDGNIRLIYKEHTLNKKTKQIIKELKPKIIKRFKENQLAREKGFLVYGYGEFYEYRFGINSFLFIERLDDSCTAWRANYRHGDKKPYKVKVMAKNVTFEKALKEASGFIDWLKKRRGWG